MFKKVLFLVLLGVILVGIVSCGPAQFQSEPEYRLERDDLIMVNLSTIKDGSGSTGVYVFFFENHPTTVARPSRIKIQFDTSLDKPIVKARGMNRYLELNGVIVVFRDKEQMKEYWIVK